MKIQEHVETIDTGRPLLSDLALCCSMETWSLSHPPSYAGEVCRVLIQSHPLPDSILCRALFFSVGLQSSCTKLL